MPAVLRSRIPQIMLSLPGEVKDSIGEGLEQIADDASSRAPVATGELADSIEASDDGIYAAWYWYFLEFGTANAGAQPFMIPALEAGMDQLLEAIENALEDL